jgi:histidine triad (HIT) family protein
MGDCIFCRIIRGELPSSKVYEDELVLAFDDIKPAAPVHVVVISKEHIPTLMDVKESKIEYLHAMMAAAVKIAQLKGIDERGFRVMLNCNPEGGQVVFHLHLHVLGGKKLGCNQD